MELSLAVTHSLSDLIRRCKVYCTEPFRIPLAGMVTTCCFDKTGTLTSDDMRFLGVILPTFMSESSFVETPCPVQNILDLPLEVQHIIIACQSLSLANSRSEDLIGDPMEKAVFQASGWTMKNDNTMAPPAASKRPEVIVKHRFIFSSKLRRMSVLASVAGSNQIFTKGAPEIVKSLLHPDSIPDSYDGFYQRQMRLGRRVLAIAYRNLGNTDISHNDISKARSVLEKQLKFAGFLVFDSPLKADSTKVIKHLRQAGLEIFMITGDSLLTAVDVATRVGLVKKHQSVYEICQSNQLDTHGASFGLVPINRTDGNSTDVVIPLSSLHSLVDCVICATGDVIESLDSLDRSIIPYIKIFARHVSYCIQSVLAVFVC